MANKPTITQITLLEIRELIKAMGDDPNREGLKGTPERVVRSWDELYSGYYEDPAEILSTTFIDGSCDEMVILKDIEFYSTCEHHLLPFFGKVSIGYVPDQKVVGISKLARLVEVFSRRLQIQERMTTQIADAIMEHVEAKGAMVIVEAQHFCMTSRGVKKEQSLMVTSAIRGVFTEKKTEARSEFLKLIK